MSNQFIIEILLALLSGAVGFATYIAMKRTERAQAAVAIVNIDAQAYERAQQIYESAIATLERRVTYLEAEVAELRKQNEEQDQELSRLRRENEALRARA